jgi:hypothetical protein
MEAGLATGHGINAGTRATGKDISTDEIFSHDFISIAHIIHDICLIHAT